MRARLSVVRRGKHYVVWEDEKIVIKVCLSEEEVELFVRATEPIYIKTPAT